MTSRLPILLALGGLFLGAAPAHASTSDFDGVWILYSAEDFGEPSLTAAGQSFRDNYNFGEDDPALACIPASWTRVFSNPNTPFEITRHADHIAMRHELFDIERKVPLVSDTSGALPHQQGSPDYPTLGSSIAWYEGDQLFIHSTDYGNESRVLSTIRGWAGLPQSALMVTLERYRRDGDQLLLQITHFDPVMYTEPLVVDYSFDLEPDFSVEHYGCEPEAAEVLTIESDGGSD